jgi:hypothetical protein
MYFRILVLGLIMIFPYQSIFGQVSINTTGNLPDVSAMLDVSAANKGILVPRVALTGTTDAVTIAAPATSLLVYNTATVNDVIPGYYYNSGSTGSPRWVLLQGIGSGWSLTGNSGTSASSNFIGTTDNVPFTIRVNNELSGRIDHLSYNTSFGYHSLGSNTFGVNNTAIGHEALYHNNESSNTAIGFQALFSNNNNGQNTAIGYQALFSNVSGCCNTATGNLALSNSTGNANTAFGFNALGNNTTGTYNTAIGYQANVSTGDLTNATAIGKGASVNSSNNFVFGNNAVVGWGFGVAPGSAAIKVGTSTSNGNGATLTLSGVWTNASDLSKKYDIGSINYGLNEIMKLHPVTYKLKGLNSQDIGFIAQEVKKIIPEIVYGEEGEMTLSYSQITPVLVKAIQELKAENDKLKIENGKQQSRMETLESRLSRLENMMEATSNK